MNKVEVDLELSVLQRAAFYAVTCLLGAYAALTVSAFALRDEGVRRRDVERGDAPQSDHGVVTSPLNTPKTRSTLRHALFVGLIMMYAYINEHTSLLPKMGKTYSPDFFMFLTGILFVGSVLTIKKSRGNADVLNRDQTEEWKGWMQFLFLSASTYVAFAHNTQFVCLRYSHLAQCIINSTLPTFII